jgi:glycine/D-amino acid oxidase-like deaminating enzyme
MPNTYHPTVIGAGYVGLATAVGLASRGHTIDLVEVYPGEHFISLWLADSGHEPLDRIPLAFKFTDTEGRRLVTRQLDGASAMVHQIAEWERLA